MTNDSFKSLWVNYAISIVLGISFSLILLLITWNNTINSKAREFELASSSIKDTVARNVQTANDTLNSFSSFLDVNPDISEQQFQSISLSLLELHDFMEGVAYVRINPDSVQMPPDFEIHIQNFRENNSSVPIQELLDEKAYADAINLLMENDSVVTLGSDYTVDNWKGFWVLRRIKSAIINSSEEEFYGFVAILINSNRLVGNLPGFTDFEILLLSDSPSLSGRQLLYQNLINNSDSWYPRSFLEESITQFPFYSVKIALTKNVLWSDIEASIFAIVLMIGSGITLLLVTLVKSKEEQAKQLRERNAVIEAQVHAQTIELAEARDEALDASKMKSSFLASMSHEIRTPLNAIIGMSDLMAEMDLDQEQRKYVSVFKKTGDTLLSLVNDMLDLSKIEADQLQLEDIEFNLENTIEESVEIYALKAAEKNLELVVYFDPEINPMRIGDPSRLRQVILNLISNALKFTDEGEIYISVTRTEGSAPDNFNLTVADTGTGIPKNKLEEIFESFSQVDSSTTRKYGGTGLGLTISRRLVEMMGGEIWVESEEGQGSDFYITLNLPIVETSSVEKEHPDLFGGQTIIIIDDNEHSRHALDTYLSHMGFSVKSYVDGGSIDENVNDPDNIHLMIIDAEISGSDGFAIAKEIKERKTNIPILMLLNPSTLNKNQQNLTELDMSGMYITKPVKKNDLYNYIYEITNSKQNGVVQASAQNNNEEIKPLKILLVDDNPDNRLMVKAYLKKMPYEIEEAENGEEALQLYESSYFDVVLMDVQMPVMDGRVATKKIREREELEQLKHTPIIALTAHAIKEEVDLCLEAGCDRHLSKPVKKSTLISTIQSMTN